MTLSNPADRADWVYWEDVHKAELWEAVALSLDFDPRRVSQWAWNASDAPADFRARLDKAKRCAGDSLPLLWTNPYGSEVQRVELAKFRAWAESLKSPWRLPERFPGMARSRAVTDTGAPRPLRPPAPTTEPRSRPRTDRLQAVIAAAKERALDPDDYMNVWVTLVQLAQQEQRPAPLLGYAEGEGVKYLTDDPHKPVGWLNQDALRKRFERAARRT